MKKRLIWLLGLGLTLIIVPFVINVYSIFRIIGLLLGIVLITISFCLKKKRSIFLILLVPILLFVASYGLDTLLFYKLKHVPVFSYAIKSSNKMFTYNSFFYRVFDCNNKLYLDYGYKKNYLCENDLIYVLDINKFLQDPKYTYHEYKNKFVRVHGKISKISGNESIELASYTSSEESLNGYVNFNLDYTLNVKSNEILSSYRIYDYIDVIGRVDSYKDNTIYLIDTVLIPSDIYDSYSFEIINNSEEKLTNLVKEKDYYYYGISSLNIKYDQDNIYELNYLLTDGRISLSDYYKNKEYEVIKDNEEVMIAKKYILDKFVIVECSNGKNIVANKSFKISSDVCELKID